jgi:hypothetical protein
VEAPRLHGKSMSTTAPARQVYGEQYRARTTGLWRDHVFARRFYGGSTTL